MSKGMVIWGGSMEALRPDAWKHGLDVFEAAQPSLCFDQNVVVRAGARPSWEFVSHGLSYLDRWDMAVPLASYEAMVCDLPGVGEQDRAELHDLRVPYFDCELVFARQGKAAEVLAQWANLMGEGVEVHLAFVRALYTVKPLVVALPPSWLDKPAMGVVARVPSAVRTRPSAVSGMVEVEIGPKRYVRCYPEEAAAMFERYKPKGRRV